MLRPEELFIDYFAGGGGASTGIEAALGRSVDVAVNHDPEALAMHKINHPKTRHIPEDIFNADIAAVCGGKPIGGAWYSPDCTYHSIARGGKPIREEGKRIRALSIIVLKHARNPATRPRIFWLENVREFQHWGPLDKNGQPCKKRKGVTFRLWWRQLERLGYRLEMRELRAFLIKYYSTGDNSCSLSDPAPTITATDKLGLVTIHGQEYQIVDIGMRMLTPRELYRAQGFHDSYVIEFDYNGKPLSKAAQVRMCGNSVCPPIAEALVKANLGATGKQVGRADRPAKQLGLL